MNILINRRGSAGDVLLLEPILTYLGKEHTVRLITDHYDIFETSDHNFKVSSRKNIFMPKYDVYISLDDVYENELRNSQEVDDEQYFAQEVIEVMKCPVCEQVYEEFLPQEIHSTDDISERSVNVFFKRVKDYLGATKKA